MPKTAAIHDVCLIDLDWMNSIKELTPDDIQTEIARRYQEIAHLLREVRSSREVSLAITNLEQSEMWWEKALWEQTPFAIYSEPQPDSRPA